MTIQNTTGLRPETPGRSGFTLVEILIVVSIIGLLVGLLVAVGNPALKRSREVAVQVEIQQMNQALENFQIENGFYPPSFEVAVDFSGNVVGGISGPADLLPFLNRIAPNHRELETPAGWSDTRLQVWWDNVGAGLNQQTSLAFWLSGLMQNKQYPLTGGFLGVDAVPVGFGANFFADPGGAIEMSDAEAVQAARRSYHNLDAQRYIDVVTATPLAESTAIPSVVAYQQEYVKQNGAQTFFLYRDSGSYLSGVNGAAYHVAQDAMGNPTEFANPNTFQIIAPGLDGDFGVANGVDQGFVFAQGVSADDNLCNFADGRLDKFINDRQ